MRRYTLVVNAAANTFSKYTYDAEKVIGIDLDHGTPS